MEKLHPLVPNYYYHIYNRGNNGETIFRSAENYRFFLERYGAYIRPIAKTYAYCLMPNHFHFLVQIRNAAIEPLDPRQQPQTVSETLQVLPQLTPKLVSNQFMKLFTSYSKAFNRQFGRTGSLFEKPFKRILVRSDAYYTELIRYIHQNPVKHGFSTNCSGWKWSSFEAIKRKGPTKIERPDVLAWLGGDMREL